MKIYLKTPEEIRKMREVNLIVAAILDAVEAAAMAGVSTWELNEVATREIQRHGVTSAFLGYRGYPAVLCTSINEVVVHGIPRKDVVLKEGDILGLDFGCYKDGFCGDSARTLPIGRISGEAQKLIDVTRQALENAIGKCVPGSRLQDISWAIQELVEKNLFSVVRSFVGHGIGRSMHEDPAVPNFGLPGRGLRLKAGLVLAIEPMVNAGTHEVDVLADNWTAVTRDRKLSAHFEHSVAITEDGPFVLSRP
ncbi:MAG: type I methionyl aminopeptidase [Deltaproteobacteria bacterium]|nr:type I methionyl aminopeptidase [Deltaproteobacteria bacterium]